MVTYRGWEAEVRIAPTKAGLATAPAVLQVTEVSFDLSQDVELLHHFGSKLPFDIKESNFEFTGSLTRYYDEASISATGRSLKGLTEPGSGSIAKQRYFMGIYPGGFGSGKPAHILEDVVFHNWSYSQAQEDIAEESVEMTFKAYSEV